MLFNSLEFLFFFPVAVAVYFLTPHKYRWAWLLGASYYFYAAWKAEYLALIIFSTLVDYWAGIKMGQCQTQKQKIPLLILSLCTNLGILFGFKYFNFFSASLNDLLQSFNIFSGLPYLEILLPVGISFYTFQTLAYTIDVYRGQKEPEKHLGYFAVYVAFFPQLVAGPIERSQHLLPQFKVPHQFNYNDAVSGLTKMAYGFFKKLVVADRLGLYVDSVFSNLESATSLSATLAILFFAIQIYCDFSGYSDIAIGTARIMGFDLMENFRRPYLSKSVREFWGRWHISLSTWFRDYLYIPLGGNRTSVPRWYSNLMIVFVVSGLWHGANWTFVVWGGLHGLYLILERVLLPYKNKFWNWAGVANQSSAALCIKTSPNFFNQIRSFTAILSTFFFVTIAWTFFRASSVTEAWYIFQIIASFDMVFTPSRIFAGLGFVNFILNLFAIALLIGSYRLPFNLKFKYPLIFLVAITMIIILLGTASSEQFIYFQF